MDIGCGAGSVLLNLDYSSEVGRNPKLTGLDTNLDALIKLKSISGKISVGRGIALIQASAESLPLRDFSIDFLICTHVLEHISNDNVAFADAVRVLAKKGFFWFAAPRPLRSVSLIHMPLMYILGRGVGHVRSGYKAIDIKSKFKRNGFKILAFFGNPDLFNFLLYLYPYTLMIFVNRMLGKDLHEKPSSVLRRFAFRIDNHLPSLPRFGSGYSIVATKLGRAVRAQIPIR